MEKPESIDEDEQEPWDIEDMYYKQWQEERAILEKCQHPENDTGV